jgi:DNA-binding transcriptional MocR family regulator
VGGDTEDVHGSGTVQDMMSSGTVQGAVQWDKLRCQRTLAAASVARGVKVQPLSWHSQRPGQPGLVLGYAANTPTDINDGIATLRTALQRLL